ncbi:FkbM family methyltransferase [Pendulispora rubella]|uniref:FkbM family methyltransferase n=1 Tax=Pendulispora rubella TaxID=2741070 RepID=A0ABZ2KTJ5_9BACT
MRALRSAEGILGAIIYQKAEAEPWPLPVEVPRIYAQMVRPQDESVAEIWYSSNPVRVESPGTVTCAHDGEYIFVAAAFTENDGGLEAQTERLYLESLRLLGRLAYTAICRIWNYVPAVNQPDRDGNERYKVFCSGRSKAFSRHFSQADPLFPAATGIGSMGGDVAVVFLAKKAEEVIHLENPAQTPAYLYPEHYGPRSPSFARATYARNRVGDGYHIFVSGTAAVLGYQSVNRGDIARQVETSIENINRVVSATNLNAYGINGEHGAYNLGSVKVYIRHAHDFAAVRKMCEQHFPKRRIAYLHADICRSDLDVEIEGIACGEAGPNVPLTLRDYFTWQTVRNARKPAYIYLDENGEVRDQISFLLLRHRVFNVASCLQRRFGKGEKLALAYATGIEFAVAYYACVLSGIVVIPIPAGDQIEIDSTLRGIRLAARTSKDGLTVLCDSHTKESVLQHSLEKTELLTLEDLWDKHQKSFQFVLVDPDDIATHWITPDSSGDAQLIPLSHKSLVEKANAEIKTWNYTNQSVSVSLVPHHRYLGLVFNLIVPICSGTTAISMAPDAFACGSTTWARAIPHYRATHAIVATDADVDGADSADRLQVAVMRTPIEHRIVLSDVALDTIDTPIAAEAPASHDAPEHAPSLLVRTWEDKSYVQALQESSTNPSVSAPASVPKERIILALLGGPTASGIEAGFEIVRGQPSALPETGLVGVYGADPDDFRAAYLLDASRTASVVERPVAVGAARCRPVALMFPGLGDQHLYMGEQLYRHAPAFKREIDRCAEILKPELGLDLRDVLYPARDTSEAPPAVPKGVDLRRMLGRDGRAPTANERRLNETRIAQPALFVVEYALARLLIAWGVQPASMLGYSLGEYVAACLSGVIGLADSLAFVARRAQLFETLPPGAMLAVALPEDQVRTLLGAQLAVSAVNGPELCVVAGPHEEIEAFEKLLAGRGITGRRVQTSYAFHSPMMQPLADRVTALARTFKLAEPTIPYTSNVTGKLITPAEAVDPRYWATHLTQPVRFSEGLRTLAAQPDLVFVEAGPGQTLSSIVIASPDVAGGARVVAPMMRNAYDRQSDMAVLLKGIGRLWVNGAAVEWSRLPSRALPSGAPSVAASSVAAQPPATEAAIETATERRLLEIWRQLFRRADITSASSFFDLGGNSLTATKLVPRLQKSFDVNASLKLVYRAPTLRSMAKAIDDLRFNPNALPEAPLVSRPTPATNARLRLSNGFVVNHQNEAETRHFYDDIFAHRSYVRHGITIRDGACVFDVGANIGLFTLFAHHEAKGVRLFSFEPAPETFALLEKNVAEHSVRATTLNYGLSNVAREASFTFYPRSSGMSSFHADAVEEKHNLKSIIANERRLGGAVQADAIAHVEGELLDVRFQPTVVTAKLRRVSDVIQEHRVERIDLMKIDVQKCEAEVIDGIDEHDWPKIRQIVLEAHDADGRVEVLRGRMVERGFSVIVQQDELYVGTNIYNLYAVRKEP